MKEFGQSGAEIQVTAAMIDAGVYEARIHPIGGNIHELVENIFRVMALEKLENEPRQS